MRRIILAALVCGLALFVVAEALAADATVRSDPSQNAYVPATETPSIPGGGTLDFENDSSGAFHSVTANGRGPDGKALFDSGTFRGSMSGVKRAVKGVQYLSARTYKFHCAVHPFMEGTLTVTKVGSPVSRPKIAVSILSTRLAKVRRSGRLKAKVRATTQSNGVSLKGRKGSKTLTHTAKLDLDAGRSKSLSLRLTKAGKKALKGLGKARVKVTGTVPFGKPAAASRKLR